jgi:hypothetical protein
MNLSRESEVARYILIEVPDNTAADAFVKSLTEGTVSYAVQTEPGEYQMKFLDGKPTGVYMQPTKYCDCPPEKNRSGIVEPKSQRGSKFGLWVHVKCGKPRMGTPQTPNNLLKPDQKPHESPAMVTYWAGLDRSPLFKDAKK